MIQKCKFCGHFQSFHPYADKKLYTGDYFKTNYQNKISETFLKIILLPKEKSDNEGRVSFLLRNVKSRRSRKITVLDVGSGLGVFPYKLRETTSWSIQCLEPDQNAARHLRSLGLECQVASLEKLSGNKKYDLITCNKVIEHSQNPRRFIRYLKKLLKPSSRLYLEVPDGEAASNDPDKFEREEFTIDHPHIFSKKGLTVLVRQENLKIIKFQRLREPSGKYTFRLICKS